MNERKEPGFDLSGLDSPRGTPSLAAPSSRAAAAGVVAPKRGGGMLLSLILLLLAAGCGGLGYLVMSLSTQLGQQQEQLSQAQQRLGDLEQMLALTSDSASQSGATLTGRIGQLETQATQKYSHFDSEIAKLWTIAYQRNKPQLEEQKKQLEQQSVALDEQKKQLAQQVDEIASLKKQLTAAGTQLDSFSAELKQLAAVKQSLTTLDKQLVAERERIGKVGADADFALSLERDERSKALQAMAARLDTLEKAPRSGGDLAPRVASVEQSIRAIDGARRQFSQELLQVRQQLNNVQLRLEGGR